MSTSKFVVGCSPLTSKLYAGSVSKNGIWSKNKKDVTDTAVLAVAQHLLQLGQKVQFDCLGETYELKVEPILKKGKKKNEK